MYIYIYIYIYIYNRIAVLLLVSEHKYDNNALMTHDLGPQYHIMYGSMRYPRGYCISVIESILCTWCQHCKNIHSGVCVAVCVLLYNTVCVLRYVCDLIVYGGAYVCGGVIVCVCVSVRGRG